VGLNELTVRNFRIFEEFSFKPDSDAVTVFVSPNGTGKTSILEAVYCLGTLGSFRTSNASHLIHSGKGLAEVHGVIFQQERRLQVDLTLTKNETRTTKQMLVNGKKPTSRALLAELMPITIFTPEGVEVIRESGSHRRHFLDLLIGDVAPENEEIIAVFMRVLRQRNAFLRALNKQQPSASSEAELNVWTYQFVEAAEKLNTLRIEIVSQLTPLVQEKYQQISQQNDVVMLRYENSWSGDLAAALIAELRHEVFRGSTTLGPHLDDLVIELNGRDSRHQASQGEQRTLALALRLAGHELVKSTRGVDPLLLLDDVFSELDPYRSDQLLELLPKGQTLVTTASPLPSGMDPAVVIDLTKAQS
jgi:DNA replication and repair protein RecF